VTIIDTYDSMKTLFIVFSMRR